jgi:hypothetical protein
MAFFIIGAGSGTLCLLWEQVDSAFYATATTLEGESTLHLIVEALPDQASWDWMIWHRGQLTALRQGEARSASSAILDAEKSLPVEFRSTWMSNGGIATDRQTSGPHSIAPTRGATLPRDW